MTDVVTVDLGGTQMRVGLVTSDGVVRQRASRPTSEVDGGADGLAELIRQLDTTGSEDAVIGLPGRIDHTEGLLETGVNLPPGWIPEFREDALEHRLGRDVHLANDADLAAVGEAWFGAGRGHDDVLYVTISTGIGAGLILGRRIVAGRRSAAEIGHTVIDYDGSMGGQPRTVEELGSGTALNAAARAAGLPEGRRLVELVRRGDPAATAVWQHAVGAAAVGIANMCWIATPTVVIVGGGMGRNGALALDPITEALGRIGPADLPTPIVVEQAQLGDDAGLAGGAAWLEARGLGC